jgi:hypothetical protein
VETISRLFRKFQEHGLVEADRKRVKITNYQQLTSMVDEHEANCLRHRL